MTKKISIITATFNSAATLQDCLASVAKQTCIDDIEHIMVDGCSTDNTLKIAAGFPHLKKLVSEPDEGIYDAFNKGLSLANGEFIYFLNSDDYLLEADIITGVLAQLDEFGLDYLSCLVIEENQQTKERSIQHPIELNFKGKIIQRPCHQGFFMKTKQLKKMGGFPRCFELAADAYVMLKQIMMGKGLFLDMVVARFLLDGASTHANSIDKITSEFTSVYTLLGLEKVKDELLANIELRKINRQLKEFLRVGLSKKELIQFTDDRVAIFGTGNMAVLVTNILAQNDIRVKYYVVSKKANDVFMGADVVDIEHFVFSGVLINTIEGDHYSEINALIEKNNIQIQCLRWNEIYG